jgi:hypothetical protein
VFKAVFTYEGKTKGRLKDVLELIEKGAGFLGGLGFLEDVFQQEFRVGFGLEVVFFRIGLEGLVLLLGELHADVSFFFSHFLFDIFDVLPHDELQEGRDAGEPGLLGRLFQLLIIVRLPAEIGDGVLVFFGGHFT